MSSHRQQDSSDKVKVALGTCKYEILRDVVGILGFEAVEVPDEVRNPSGALPSSR